MSQPAVGDPEAVVWESAVQGSPTAWRLLYDANFRAVADYVQWRLKGLPDLFDDVLQETWLTATQKLASFDPSTCRFAGWVCGIAGNVVRHHLRSRMRYLKRVAVVTASQTASVDADADRDRAERVAWALTRLPEHYEQVLRAKYLDGQSVEEIATLRATTTKAVESLLTRARQAFREEYERDR